MRNLGNIFVSFGLFFLGLGSWEQIYLFSTTPKTDRLVFKANMPEYLWNLTNVTFGFGVILLIVGIIMAIKGVKK